ncbi:hypothetical protein [Rhodanobacter sp. DHB23]|uniref:hypothetical protein n=1 Tax=Rhodanobacter sp. DHB23 TaxID=2775923 RepID=UPI00177E6811|nr:hypothetical protein [Rhodanobacter sp. DHB23]MBD8872216.1 hypothetical protein [Rhodanobacter sp. DHB23]
MRLHILGLWLFVAPTLGWAQGVRACPAPSAADYYFPANTFVGFGVESVAPTDMDRLRSGDSYQRERYSDSFNALGLRSWSCGGFGQGYRFVWLRSFDAPVSVSIVRGTTGWVLDATELNVAGGLRQGAALRTAHIALNARQIEYMRKQIELSDAWSVPTNSTYNSNGNVVIAADGAQWIIELRDGDRYHVIDRFSPKNGPARALGLAFLALTGWQFPARETY